MGIEDYLDDDTCAPRRFSVNGTFGAAIALKQFYGTVLIGSRRPTCGLHKLLFRRCARMSYTDAL